MTIQEYIAANAALTDAEISEAIAAKTQTRIVSRFGSFRTLASLLTVEEYQTVRNTLDAAAAQSVMLADMVAMMRLPGDEAGNGGGINLGDLTVRAMIDAMFPIAISEKITGYAVEDVSLSELNGWPLYHAGDIAAMRPQEVGE